MYSSCDEVQVYADNIMFSKEYSGITLHMENNSSETVTTGNPFTVYRYENGDWRVCEVSETRAWTIESLMILPGRTRELNCDLGMFDV